MEGQLPTAFGTTDGTRAQANNAMPARQLGQLLRSSEDALWRCTVTPDEAISQMAATYCSQSLEELMAGIHEITLKYTNK